MAKIDGRSLSVYLGIFFLLSVFVVPPLCPVHTNPMTSFWTEWLSGILLLASWGLLFLSKGEEFPLPAAVWPWLAWGLALVLSVLANHYDLWQPVIFAAVFWIMGLLSLLLGAELALRVGRERTLTIIAYTMVVSGLLQAIAGVLRFYGLLAHFSIFLRPLKADRLEGLFNYPTLTGFSLWLSICALVYLFCKRRLGWSVLTIGSLIMAVPIVATGNRSSVLYWFSLVFVALVILIKNRKPSGKASEVEGKRIWGAIAVVTLVAIVSIPLFKQLDGIVGPYMQAAGYVERSQNVDDLYNRKGDFWGIRGSAFKKAIYLAEHSPFFGIGPGNYSYQNFLLNDKPYSIREGTIDTHTHNIFSMLLAEEGIFGLLVLTIGCILLVWWWWRLGVSLEALFAGAVLMDFFFYSNIEYPLWYLNFLVIFMVFVGLVSPVKTEKLHWPPLKTITALTFLIIGGIFSWYVARGYIEISSVKLNSLASMKDARKLEKWFSSPLWAAEAGQVFEHVTVAGLQGIPDQLSLSQQVIEHLPTPPALLHKILLLDFQGRIKEACALAEKTASSYPHIYSSFQHIEGWYDSNPKINAANLKKLEPCFQKGVDSWQAQWK